MDSFIRDILRQTNLHTSSFLHLTAPHLRRGRLLDIPNLKLDILDADFLARFLVIIIPLPFGQINAREGGWCFCSFCFPVSLSFTQLASNKKRIRD